MKRCLAPLARYLLARDKGCHLDRIQERLCALECRERRLVPRARVVPTNARRSIASGHGLLNVVRRTDQTFAAVLPLIPAVSPSAIGPDICVVRLIRDRDGIFGSVFNARVRNLGVRQLVIARRSPWQNGYAERWVGTLRRELLDHVIVLGQRHLLRLVRAHVSYYNDDRPHMSLDGDAPVARPVERPSDGSVVALPRVGGLHHRYARQAA
jgi:hypothetical protein